LGSWFISLSALKELSPNGVYEPEVSIQESENGLGEPAFAGAVSTVLGNPESTRAA
jgi:hypothetical protein